MTRRPILIGVGAMLALALTAGLAYGSGWTGGTQPRNSHSVDQIAGTQVTPGYGWSHHRQGPNMGRFGPAFRDQMRDWMDAWMRDHNRDGRSWTGTRFSRQGSGGAGSYSNGTHDGYLIDHYTTGSHGYGGYGYGGGWHDDCW